MANNKQTTPTPSFNPPKWMIAAALAGTLILGGMGMVDMHKQGVRFPLISIGLDYLIGPPESPDSSSNSGQSNQSQHYSQKNIPYEQSSVNVANSFYRMR